MTAEYERRLLARAHGLDDTEDLAEEVTAILGGARAARLDPDALPGLAGAALALGADSLTVYRAEAALFADDGEFAAAIEDAAASITGHAAAAARLRAETATALEAARDDLETALAELAAAHAMAAGRPCDGCHGRKADAIAAAEAHIAEARERIACAQAAAGVLGELAQPRTTPAVPGHGHSGHDPGHMGRPGALHIRECTRPDAFLSAGECPGGPLTPPWPSL